MPVESVRRRPVVVSMGKCVRRFGAAVLYSPAIRLVVSVNKYIGVCR